MPEYYPKFTHKNRRKFLKAEANRNIITAFFKNGIERVFDIKENTISDSLVEYTTEMLV